MSLLIEELARSRVRELYREAEAQRMVRAALSHRSGGVGRLRRAAGRALVVVGNRVAGAAAAGSSPQQTGQSAR